MGNESYESLLRRFAQKLKEARKEKGWTQEKMAELGFNYRHYQKLESGSYSPSLRTVYNLSRILKKEFTYFFSKH